MLRITVHDNPESPTVQLEGTLAGPWVREAETALRPLQTGSHPTGLFLDLTGVTTIDAAGKSFLAKAHSAGANFVASGCMMRAIVAEITEPGRNAKCPIGISIGEHREREVSYEN